MKSLCRRTSSRRAATALALALAFPAVTFGAVVEKIVVVVNGVPHTYSDLRKFTQTRLGQDVRLDELTAGRVPKRLVEEFINAELIKAEVRGTGIQVRNADIDAYITRVRKRNNLTLAQLTAALKRDGKEMEQYREQIRDELERGELIDRNVRQKVHITQGDAQRYYDANPHRFLADMKVHLRHIMLEVEEGAPSDRAQTVLGRVRELRQEALDGADFAALARAHSQGAGASEGGDIGWLQPDSLPDSLARVAAVLDKGSISQPVRTNLGYHLVKVEDRQGGQQLPFTAVSEQISQELYRKTLDERFAKWLKTDLRKKHRVQVKLDGYAFEAQEVKRGTVGNLMAATGGEEEKGFWDYLNPFTYIYDEEAVEGDRKVVKFFGVPFFTTEAGDDEDVPLNEPFPDERPKRETGSGTDAAP